MNAAESCMNESARQLSGSMPIGLRNATATSPAIS